MAENRKKEAAPAFEWPAREPGDEAWTSVDERERVLVPVAKEPVEGVGAAAVGIKG